MLHNFHIFGPIKKALKGYTVIPDDNMREVWYRGLGRSPKNSLQSRYAELCASRGFLSKCLWWTFLIVAIPSPVSTLKNVLCVYASHYVHDQLQTVQCVWNVMAHAQKPDFIFRRNGQVHLNRRGHNFSQLLAAEVCASVSVMLDTPHSEVVWRVLATHSIRQFPLHFLSRASPCVIRFQTHSTSMGPPWQYKKTSKSCCNKC